MNGKQLKNSILQWAIQGKLVPQDPTDEPASVLLERIREEKARLVKEKKIKKDKNESIIFRGDDNSHYEKFADGTVKCIDDEIPFEIPQGWEWTRIGNIFNHASGKQQSSNNKSSGTPQKFITTSNLYWGYFVLDNVKVMNFTEDEIKTCSATKGDLLVCEGGAGYGRSAIWNEDYDICLQNHVHRLRPCINGVCEYVYYFIYLLKESNNLASVGTAMPGLSANRLKGLLLPFPPLAEQMKIVAKLGKILPLVEKYGKVQSCADELNIQINDKLKKSILQEAIQGKLVSQNPNDEPASVLLDRIKDEKSKLFKEGRLKKKDLVDSIIFKGDDNKYYETVDGKTECIDDRIPFELPHNWCWATLGNLVQNSSGLAYKKENLDERSTSYIRVLRGGNIDDGQWTMKDDDVMIASKFVKPELLLTAGTFITPAVTSIEQMGKTALVRDDQPQTVVGGFVLMLLPFLRDWSLLDYLELIFQSEYYKGYCRSITNKSGQAFYNLSRQKLMQFLVPLPPLNERIAIANEVAKINSMMR